MEQEILSYYGIIQKNEMSKETENDCKKILEYLHKKMKISKAYLYGDFAVNKITEKSSYIIYVFCDIKTDELPELRRKCETITEKDIGIKQETFIKPGTLQAFEKRSSMPSEIEYYIKQYGILLYDNKEKSKIKEARVPTQYSFLMDTYEFVKRYVYQKTEVRMSLLLRLYVLKIGYMDLGQNSTFEINLEFAYKITKDNYVLDLLQKFNNADATEEQKIRCCNDFEQHIKRLKKSKNSVNGDIQKKKLTIIHPYSRKYLSLLWHKKCGDKLPELTKDLLYEMVVEEGQIRSKVADLYGVDNKEIERLTSKWKIKALKQGLMSNPDFIQKVLQDENYEGNNEILKQTIGIPTFDDLYISILAKLSDSKIHDIIEFWNMTSENYEIADSELVYCASRKNPTLYYRANWCLQVLQRAGLIIEATTREYLITQRGFDFLNECKENKIEKITISFLKKKYPDYIENIEIIDGYPEMDKEEEEIRNTEVPKRIKPQEDTISTEKQEEQKASEVQETPKVLEVHVAKPEEISKILKEKTERKKAEKKKSNPKERKARKIDYVAIQEKKKELGDECEEIALHYEKNRLIEEGRKDLAAKVVWVPKEEGDGLGYDIISYEKINGIYRKIYIEVKGTEKSCDTPFPITQNEVKVSKEKKERYCIFRIGRVHSKNPEFYKKYGSLQKNYKLTATNYLAEEL